MSISFTDLIILLEILNTSVGIHSRDKQILKNKQYQTFPKSNRKIVGTTDIISYIYNVKVLVFGSIGNICVFSAVKRKTKNPSYSRNSSKTHHTVGTVQKPITLSEQFQNPSHCRNSSKTHHTVGTVQKPITLSEQFKNPSHCQKSSKTHHTVGTVQKPITLSEQFKNQSHCRNSSKTHHTVRKVQKPITLSEQFKNPSHCRNSSKI
jgi:hypothetical protein